MSFFTYIWFREDGSPYYVGKTNDLRRAYGRGRHCVHAPTSRDRVIVQEWPSESTAVEAEKFLIARYGRKDIGTGILHNHTDGGEGSLGWKQPLEIIEKRVSKIRGRKRPQWVRDKISVGKRGDKNPSHKAAGPFHWNRRRVA